ncbi:T-lymphocyte surface antigen Ly-9 isoform X3 [Hylobates moloch]|nr:T-lymphocyte surface antigen Ly-9 isoform X3 [Hylobates moloch]XP_058298484.1 T-lymphocyte surface antigen Ly-9 isoform X3 [Hylobates moloch]
MKSVKVSENFSCNIILMCSVKGAEKSVLYSWTPRDPHASESNGGSILTISRTPCDPDLPYTCTAQNPVSQSSSLPVHVGQFCTDPGASRGGTTGETVVGVLGEPVTLPLALPACRDTEKVVWLFNTSVISKEREEAATADPLIKSRDPYKNRLWVSSQDCSLKIGRLKIEDAGPYHAYVCSEASRVTSTTHVTLLIYRPERNTKLWIVLFLMVCLPCVGIFSWCIWKRKGRCSVPAFCSSQAEAPGDTPALHNVFQNPQLATRYTLCSPKGMRSWTLPSGLPGNSLHPPQTAALTATSQLRRMRTGPRCTSPSVEETRCVTRSLRRVLDITQPLRAKQTMILSLHMSQKLSLWLERTPCMHKCSTYRERPQFLRRKRAQPQSTAPYRNLRWWCRHYNRMILRFLKVLPMKISPERKSSCCLSPGTVGLESQLDLVGPGAHRQKHLRISFSASEMPGCGPSPSFSPSRPPKPINSSDTAPSWSLWASDVFAPFVTSHTHSVSSSKFYQDWSNVAEGPGPAVLYTTFSTLLK